ncbi:MAG: flippase-like domain-containing protein [Deltaproteobacteria bacterium]|nr:flippase-like domain-containing protein [Deltaproteobacteria bacterium]
MKHNIRRLFKLLIKAIITIGVFVILLRHEIVTADGIKQPIWQALLEQLDKVDIKSMLPFLLAAIFIKSIGIFSSMKRWQLLLRGQGIRFNLWHIIGSFLVGRFLGTFLPSTIGLDGYKLYDAARFSGKTAEPTAATAVEKIMGLVGILLTFTVALPFGYHVLEEHAIIVALITVPVTFALIILLLLFLFNPEPVTRIFRFFSPRRGKIADFIDRVSRAASAYKGRKKIFLSIIGLSFLVHFCTATMYYFTALAIGVTKADFWQITFASSIQIVATVLSPFTIAGEGVREVVQALLLAKSIGVSASVLSGALGFWAAEALTLFGAIFLWTRRESYRPRVCEIDNNA